MRFIPHIKITSLTFIWLMSLFFTSLGNIVFWLYIQHMIIIDNIHSLFFSLSIPLFIFAIFNIIFSLSLWPYLRKPLSCIILTISAASSYFMITYKVIIDRNMVQNLFETDQAEALSYFAPLLFIWLVFFGLLPTLAVLRIRFVPEKNWESIWRWMGNMVISFIILLMIAFGFYKDYASLFRNNRILLHTITPINYIQGSYSYLSRLYRGVNQTIIPIGEDAKRPDTSANTRPKLVILIVGETARAQNFSLNGYERNTNPLLSQRAHIISFQNMFSCGTATAISLPCMFSPMPREQFNEEQARQHENLVDVVQRTGVKVLWRENNNGGCKKLCARVSTEEMTQLKTSLFCKNQNGTCFDNVLLDNLDQRIHSLKGDGLIVLHQLGSHGPTYYQRYPREQQLFTPTCETNQIQNCDRQTLQNTYDNTIVYTDQMIDQTINLLNNWRDQYDIALLYLSDHGESLGEKGLYLHGMPYVFAPIEQKHIPMIQWFSDEWIQNQHLNLACLQQKAKTDLFNHDYLFHTVLGLFDIQTTLYQPDLDILSSCLKS